MPRARHVCPAPSCPELTSGGRCPTHRRQTEQARGTRQQRGYDADHLRLRKRLEPIVATGTVTCKANHCLREDAGQSRLISPTDAWDLGHNDARTAYNGPEHAECNRSTGGHASHTR